MHELLQHLKELTTLDAAIVQQQDQLARYPVMLARLAADEAAHQKTITEADAALEALLRDRRQAEKEVATIEAQIRRYQQQQAVVKTNKEYEAITGEIETHRAKVDRWETAALEKLETEEVQQKRKKIAAEQLAKLKIENDAERRRIADQTAEKRERLARLSSERERKMADLPEDLRETYTHVNQKCPGSAVVPLEGDTCGGCHWSLVAQIGQQVRSGKELIRCEHCHRFLFSPGSH